MENGKLEQVKGKTYTLARFLGDEENARRYEHGSYFNFYLSPQDYHHVHSPVGGGIARSVHIPGKLWPVNDWSLENIDELFSINERVVTYVDGDLGRVAVVMIGATNVGKISVTYDSFISNSDAERTVARDYPSPMPIAAGARLGTFHMGSSVVVLVEPDRVDVKRVRLEAGKKGSVRRRHPARRSASALTGTAAPRSIPSPRSQRVDLPFKNKKGGVAPALLAETLTAVDYRGATICQAASLIDEIGVAEDIVVWFISQTAALLPLDVRQMRSASPSAFMSPTPTRFHGAPTEGSETAELNVVPFISQTAALNATSLRHTRSILPSRLKSPTPFICQLASGTVGSETVERTTLSCMRSAVRANVERLRQIRSGNPSPLRSPAATTFVFAFGAVGPAAVATRLVPFMYQITEVRSASLR